MLARLSTRVGAKLVSTMSDFSGGEERTSPDKRALVAAAKLVPLVPFNLPLVTGTVQAETPLLMAMADPPTDKGVDL